MKLLQSIAVIIMLLGLSSAEASSKSEKFLNQAKQAWENKSYQKAINLFEQSVQWGSNEGRDYLINIYSSKEFYDPKKVARLIKPLAMLGEMSETQKNITKFAPYQYQLAEMYLTGQGVKKDIQKSIKWHKFAARALPQSAMRLGLFYLEPSLGIQNFEESYKWSKQALSQSAKSDTNKLVLSISGFLQKYNKTQHAAELLAIYNSQGINSHVNDVARQAISTSETLAIKKEDSGFLLALAELYRLGLWVDGGHDRMTYLLEMSADLGNVDAMYQYGIALMGQDEAPRGHRYMRMASLEGHYQAPIRVAENYYYGHGVKKSLKHAIDWAEYAINEGIEQGKLKWFEWMINKYDANSRWRYVSKSDSNAKIYYAPEWFRPTNNQSLRMVVIKEDFTAVSGRSQKYDQAILGTLMYCSTKKYKVARYKLYSGSSVYNEKNVEKGEASDKWRTIRSNDIYNSIYKDICK
ncbi:tetratricopeptide repeat protein [Kangiella taiwanensis]|uniref:Surface-adhesin protein E-like domain-containing protein n=1 Tax=Kangiella taiwanensis TaxID=1079179 RepID=A0ABP8I733_9GAMM|nr:surface-adhesin E family protein [Kangiella taiwanensis]